MNILLLLLPLIVLAVLMLWSIINEKREMKKMMEEIDKFFLSLKAWAVFVFVDDAIMLPKEEDEPESH